MRLPVIKHINSFIEENDADFVHETIDFLEHLAQARGLKDEELDVIGEILSNAYGALEVQKAMAEGQTEREALNGFMQRVTGSIDS